MSPRLSESGAKGAVVAGVLSLALMGILTCPARFIYAAEREGQISVLASQWKDGTVQGDSRKSVKRQLDAADQLLNKTYRETLKTLEQARATELRARQREWVTFRDKEVLELAIWKSNGDENADPAKIPECAEFQLALTLERIEFFKAFAGKGVAAGIPGTYMDSFGGSLELKEATDGVAFEIAVVRGRLAGRLGLAEGVARWDGTDRKDARWVDPKDSKCWIKFRFLDRNRIIVEAESCRIHVGHRASFAGEYFKVPAEDSSGRRTGAATSPSLEGKP